MPAWVARCVPRLQGVIAAGSTPDTALDPVSTRRGSGRTVRPSYGGPRRLLRPGAWPRAKRACRRAVPGPAGGCSATSDPCSRGIRTRHLSPRTEEAYVFWIRRYVLFHGKRHPAELGGAEVTRFLSHLAVAARVSASTQNQALSALLFLYRRVLHIDLPWLEGLVRAKRPARLPVVLSRDEVAAVLAHLDGVRWLVAALLSRTVTISVRFKNSSVTATSGRRWSTRTSSIAAAAASSALSTAWWAPARSLRD